MQGKIKVQWLAAVFVISVGSAIPDSLVAHEDKVKIASTGLDAAFFSRRHRRQIGEEPFRSCSQLQHAAVCGSSYAQSYIDVLSRCGQQAADEIRNTEYGCRTNENNRFCSEVVTSSIMFNVTVNCTSGCSLTCRAALNSARTKMGCCATYYFGNEFSSCSFSPPDHCTRSTLKIPAISQDGYCTTTKRFKERKFYFYCNNRYPITNFLRSEGCYGTAGKYNWRCREQDGQYCVNRVDAFSDLATPPAQRSLNTAARFCDVESTNCSSQCNSSLVGLSEELGCCVHSLNVSMDLFPYLDTSFFNYSVWEKCDVTIPCSHTSVSSGVVVAPRSLYFYFAVCLVIILIIVLVA